MAAWYDWASWPVRTAWSAAPSGTHLAFSDFSLVLPASVLANVLEFSPGTWTVVACASAADAFPPEAAAPPAPAAFVAAAVGGVMAADVAKSAPMVRPATATGSTDPKTDVAEDHVLPRSGRMASAAATTTAMPASATPMPAVTAETECGPSTASQKTATAALTATAVPNTGRDGRLMAPMARATWASAARIPMVACVPFRWPEDMAKSRTAEPPSVTASRMASGRLVPPSPRSRVADPGAS